MPTSVAPAGKLMSRSRLCVGPSVGHVSAPVDEIHPVFRCARNQLAQIGLGCALVGCTRDAHFQGSQCNLVENVGFTDPTPWGPSLSELIGPLPATVRFTPGGEIPSWIPPSQEWLNSPPVITLAPAWDSFASVRPQATSDDCDVGVLVADGVGEVEITALSVLATEVPVRLRVDAPNLRNLSGLHIEVPVLADAVIAAMLAEDRTPPLEGWEYRAQANMDYVSVYGIPVPGYDGVANHIVKRAALVDPPLFAGGRLRSDGTLLPED